MATVKGIIYDVKLCSNLEQCTLLAKSLHVHVKVWRLQTSVHRIQKMTSRRSTINEDTNFWTLKLLQERPGITQRALAKEVGMSLSGINYCVSALAEKGWIKMGNCSKNPDKLSYAYLLTPTGMAEKTALTKRFLQRKTSEYEKLRGEIEALQNEVSPP